VRLPAYQENLFLPVFPHTPRVYRTWLARGMGRLLAPSSANDFLRIAWMDESLLFPTDSESSLLSQEKLLDQLCQWEAEMERGPIFPVQSEDSTDQSSHNHKNLSIPPSKRLVTQVTSVLKPEVAVPEVPGEALGSPAKVLSPKRLTQLIHAFVPKLSQGLCLRPLLLTIVFPRTITRQDAWEHVPESLQYLQRVVPAFPSLRFAMIAVETHPGTHPKKKQEQQGKKRKGEYPDRDLDSASEEEKGLVAGDVVERSQDGGSASHVKDNDAKSLKGMAGYPHIHLFVALDHTEAIQISPELIQERLLSNPIFLDVNIKVRPRSTQWDWFKMMRYVCKGYNCQTTKANLLAIREPAKKAPVIRQLQLSLMTCWEHSQQRNGYLFSHLFQFLRMMKETASDFDVVEESLMSLAYQHEARPADLTAMLAAPLSKRAMACRRLSTMMVGEHHLIRGNDVYVPISDTPYALAHFMSISAYLSYLSSIENIQGIIIDNLKFFREELGQLDIFPRAIISYDHIGLKDRIYEISTGIIRFPDCLPKGMFVMRYFPVLACDAVEAPLCFMKLLHEHLLDGGLNPQEAFKMDFARLFRPRTRKQKVPFLWGKANTGKTVILDLIREFYVASDIGTINTGNFPFSDFVRPRRLLICDEFSTSTCKRSDFLRVIQGGHCVVEAKSKDAPTVYLDCPAILAASTRPEYKNDNSGSVDARLVYYQTWNPVNDRVDQSHRDAYSRSILQEAPQVLIHCNNLFLEFEKANSN